MAATSVMNVTDQPVVVDDAGHVLGGGEWADLDTSAPRVAAHILAGRIIVPALPAAGPAPAAKAVGDADTAVSK